MSAVAPRSRFTPPATCLALAAAAALLTTACGASSSRSTSAAVEPPPPGVEILEAMRLEGPFRDLSEFCQLLTADECLRDAGEVIMPSGGARATTGDAQQLAVRTVVSTEGDLRRIWLLIERGGELWALPPTFEHPVDSPLVPTVTVTSLRHDTGFAPDLVRLDWSVAFRADGTDDVAQSFEVSELCLVPAGEPLACAHVNTSAAVDREDREATVELRVSGNEVVVTPIETADAQLSARLPAEGRYQLRFAR